MHYTIGFIPALARLARAIQQRGALAVLQLNHGGRFAKTGQPLSPSALDTTYIPFGANIVDAEAIGKMLQLVFDSSHISKPIADFGHPTSDLTSKL